MEDHYLELIHQGKSEHEAIGAVISEFGSVDELLQELNVSKEEPIDDWSDAITEDDAFDYWGTVRHFAFSLSLGIGFCIAAFAALMLFVSFYAELFGVMVMILLSPSGLVLSSLAVCTFPVLVNSWMIVQSKGMLNEKPLSNSQIMKKVFELVSF